MREGTGEIRIRSPTESSAPFDIKYFEVLTHREQILFPFKVVDRVNKFDIDVDIINPTGMSCLAKAMRYAISKALCSFVSTDSIEKLRLGLSSKKSNNSPLKILYYFVFFCFLAGLLTSDTRQKERKKPGQEGARRKYTWFVLSYPL